MSLLTICQNAALEIGLPEPTQIIGSAGQTEKELLGFVRRVGNDVRLIYSWPHLRKTATITLVDGQDSYALPADFDRHLYETHWDRTNQWPLLGPLTPQEWRARKEGITTTSPRNRFTLKGYGRNQFYVDPTPDSTNAGNVLVFEYQSTTWFQPAEWQASTVYTLGEYASYDGEIFSYGIASGDSGTTPPTPTSSGFFTYIGTAYTEFLADTDYVVLPEKMIELGVIYKFLRAKGLPYEHVYKEYDDFTHDIVGSLRGARTLNLAMGTISRRFIGPENVSDTGFGS